MSKKKYIEMSWNKYRNMVVPPDASDAQVDGTRQAFYAGASILFTTLMFALDPGEQETEADMRLMESLQAEINEFGLEMDLKILPVGGHG